MRIFNLQTYIGILCVAGCVTGTIVLGLAIGIEEFFDTSILWYPEYRNYKIMGLGVLGFIGIMLCCCGNDLKNR